MTPAAAAAVEPGWGETASVGCVESALCSWLRDGRHLYRLLRCLGSQALMIARTLWKHPLLTALVAVSLGARRPLRLASCIEDSSDKEKQRRKNRRIHRERNAWEKGKNKEGEVEGRRWKGRR